LVLPGSCAGCGAGVPGSLCPNCTAVLAGLRPHAVRPTPAPAGLPACVALGSYDGVLREVLLAYKERGRHVLARPLGDWLAAAVHGGAVVIPVDDILTTGGTLAALAGRLRAGGLPVPVAAVLAATRRRTGPRTAPE